MIFDYIDGGAEDELTVRANRAAFERVCFRPEALVDVRRRSTATELVGVPAALPLVLAPAGLTRIVHPEGELAVARAAAQVGLPYVATPWSSVTIEELAAVLPGRRLWFEVHPMADLELRTSLMHRAAASGVGALVYLVDSALPGRRERELQRGIAFPPRYSVRNILDAARRPRWALGFTRTAHQLMPVNIAPTPRRSLPPTVPPLGPIGRRIGSNRGTWADLEQVRDAWDRPLIVKGIMSAADAERAVDAGADCVVVSNHGGRQLDGLPATLEVLPEVVDAVSKRVPVLVDGGIRRGSDIAKALALGARGCLIGRAYHYGLAVGGQAGVERVVEMLATELSLTLGLLGRTSVGQLDGGCLAPASPGPRTAPTQLTPTRVEARR
jgi:isopentenyl diphosphate isomerase/L-lactate dehydrogenase-like FMN-dependent dehydrogenase